MKIKGGLFGITLVIEDVNFLNYQLLQQFY
jgi:hypothetical protein